MEWAGTQSELEEYVDRMIAEHDKAAFAIMHRIAAAAVAGYNAEATREGCAPTSLQQVDASPDRQAGAE